MAEKENKKKVLFNQHACPFTDNSRLKIWPECREKNQDSDSLKKLELVDLN